MKKTAVIPHTEWEFRFGYPLRIVVGVDEVGRGCLAGPVVAGAAILPKILDYDACPWISEVRDSKQLSPEKRERLAPLIRGWVRASAIGIASVEEIDQLNIHHAVHLAMVRAVKALGKEPDHVLVDGKFPPRGLNSAVTAIVKGDQVSLSIACASIVAKVWRDQKMVELDQKFPGYGLSIHKGYPTLVHSEALKRQGVTEIHRRSFGPVRECVARDLLNQQQG